MNEVTQKALDDLYGAKAYLDGINFDYLDEIVGELMLTMKIINLENMSLVIPKIC